MVDNYDYFFKSIQEFTLNLDLVSKNINPYVEYQNFDDNLIENEICPSIKSFLTNYTDVEFKNDSLGSAFFNYSTILRCWQRVIERNVLSDILNVKVINGWEERCMNFKNSNLIFLKYDMIGSSYLYADNNIENPILYIYWEGGEITSDDIVFTSYIRGVIFWEIISEFQKSSMNIKFMKIPWLQFYRWFYLNQKNQRNSIISWRYEFNCTLQKNQIEKSRLLGVDEFEVEFIKYLIENKGLKNAMDVFNPYSTLVTFKEYL